MCKKSKKMIRCILIGTMLVTLLGGCGSSGGSASGGRASGQPAGVEDVLQAGMQEEDAQKADSAAAPSAASAGTRQSGVDQNAPEPEESAEGVALSGTEGIDIDLTSLSSTLVYSEVFNMMNNPDAYVGKTVKMGGRFAAYYSEAVDTRYYACIIRDAAACCSQGMEFVLTEDYSYPEDYPEEGNEITVVGTFDTYMEDGYLYCTLRNARLL